MGSFTLRRPHTASPSALFSYLLPSLQTGWSELEIRRSLIFITLQFFFFCIAKRICVLIPLQIQPCTSSCGEGLLEPVFEEWLIPHFKATDKRCACSFISHFSWFDAENSTARGKISVFYNNYLNKIKNKKQVLSIQTP